MCSSFRSWSVECLLHLQLMVKCTLLQMLTSTFADQLTALVVSCACSPLEPLQDLLCTTVLNPRSPLTLACPDQAAGGRASERSPGHAGSPRHSRCGGSRQGPVVEDPPLGKSPHQLREELFTIFTFT